MHPDGAKAPAPRLPVVDAVRGFALFGVYGANLFVFSGIALLDDAGRQPLVATVLDRVVYTAELLLVENKFMGLFSFLFGVSFWLFLERVEARTGRGLRLFYRRIFWLFVIGAVHGWLCWCFDILRFYALWGALLPLFAAMRPRRLLVTALVTALLVPAVISAWDASRGLAPAPGASLDRQTLEAFRSGSFLLALQANWTYDWYLTMSVSQIGYQVAVFGRLLLGLAAARGLALGDLGRHRTLFVRLLAGGLLVGLAGNLVFAAGWWQDDPRPAVVFARRLAIQCGYLGLTLAYASGVALSFSRPTTRALALRLAPLGQMALTWYLLQTMVGLWLFYGWMPGPHWMTAVPARTLARVWIVGYALQVTAASWWMTRFRYGPAEWLWRSLTYGSLQPMRRLVA